VGLREQREQVVALAARWRDEQRPAEDLAVDRLPPR
jgi:hypothetical protein